MGADPARIIAELTALNECIVNAYGEAIQQLLERGALRLDDGFDLPPETTVPALTATITFSPAKPSTKRARAAPLALVACLEHETNGASAAFLPKRARLSDECSVAEGGDANQEAHRLGGKNCPFASLF